jgi:hypothetical protein
MMIYDGVDKLVDSYLCEQSREKKRQVNDLQDCGQLIDYSLKLMHTIVH